MMRAQAERAGAAVSRFTSKRKIPGDRTSTWEDHLAATGYHQLHALWHFGSLLAIVLAVLWRWVRGFSHNTVEATVACSRLLQSCCAILLITMMAVAVPTTLLYHTTSVDMLAVVRPLTNRLVNDTFQTLLNRTVPALDPKPGETPNQCCPAQQIEFSCPAAAPTSSYSLVQGSVPVSLSVGSDLSLASHHAIKAASRVWEKGLDLDSFWTLFRTGQKLGVKSVEQAGAASGGAPPVSVKAEPKDEVKAEDVKIKLE